MGLITGASPGQYGPRFRFRIAHRHFLAITGADAIASVLKRRPEAFRKGPRLVQVAKDLGPVTQRLRKRWNAKADDGEEIDLLPDLMRYTVDVTTCLAFGHDLNTLEQGDDVAIQRHLNVIFPALFKRNLAAVDLAHWFKDRVIEEHVSALRQEVQNFMQWPASNWPAGRNCVIRPRS